MSGEVPPDEVRVVLVTGPDERALVALGRRAVEARCAACVNVVPGITSIFRWQGEVQESPEALAILKTTGDRLDALRRLVLEEHPYEEPEFVALTLSSGSASYLAWVADGVRDGPGNEGGPSA